MSIFKFIAKHLLRQKEVLEPPERYPNSGNVVAWMEDMVRYYQVMCPERLFALFDPTYADYLPFTIHVGVSHEAFHKKYIQHYREIKARFPEELKKRGKDDGVYIYRAGDPEDYEPY